MSSEAQIPGRATRVESAISKRLPILLAMAISSLGTSWFYKTPELSQKAERLEVVEQKVIPKLRDVAGCQTQRARVATQQAVQSESGADVHLEDIPHCPLLPKTQPKASPDEMVRK